MQEPQDIFTYLEVRAIFQLNLAAAFCDAADHAPQRPLGGSSGVAAMTRRMWLEGLQQNEVGHRHALLYLAHASYLERRGAHTAAKAAYELGIGRSGSVDLSKSPLSSNAPSALQVATVIV